MPRNKKQKNTKAGLDGNKLQKILENWNNKFSRNDNLSEEPEEELENFINESLDKFTLLSYPTAGVEGSGEIRNKINKKISGLAEVINKISTSSRRHQIKEQAFELKQKAVYEIAYRTKQLLDELYRDGRSKPYILQTVENLNNPPEFGGFKLFQSIIYKDFSAEFFQLKARLNYVFELIDNNELNKLTIQSQLEIRHLITNEIGERAAKLKNETKYLIKTGFFKDIFEDKIYFDDLANLFQVFYSIRHTSKYLILKRDGSNWQEILQTLSKFKYLYSQTKQLWNKLEDLLEIISKGFYNSEDRPAENEKKFVKNVISQLPKQHKLTQSLDLNDKVKDYGPGELIDNIVLNIDFLNSDEALTTSEQYKSNLQKQSLIILKHSLNFLWDLTGKKDYEDNFSTPLAIVQNTETLRNFIVHEDNALDTNLLNRTLKYIKNFSLSMKGLVIYIISSSFYKFISEGLSTKEELLSCLKLFDDKTSREIDMLKTKEDLSAYIMYLRMSNASLICFREKWQQDILLDPGSKGLWRFIKSDKVQNFLKYKLLNAAWSEIFSEFYPATQKQIFDVMKEAIPEQLEKSNQSREMKYRSLKHSVNNNSTIYKYLSENTQLLEDLEKLNNLAPALEDLTDTENLKDIKEYFILQHKIFKDLAYHKNSITKIFTEADTNNAEELEAIRCFIQNITEIIQLRNQELNRIATKAFEDNLASKFQDFITSSYKYILEFMHKLNDELTTEDWKKVYNCMYQPYAKYCFLKIFTGIIYSAYTTCGNLDKFKDEIKDLIVNSTSTIIERLGGGGWNTEESKVLLAWNHLRYLLYWQQGNSLTKKAMEKHLKGIDTALDKLSSIKSKQVCYAPESIEILIVSLVQKAWMQYNSNKAEKYHNPISVKVAETLKLVCILQKSHNVSFEEGGGNFKHIYNHIMTEYTPISQDFKKFVSQMNHNQQDVLHHPEKYLRYKDPEIIQAGINKFLPRSNSSEDDSEKPGYFVDLLTKLENLINYFKDDGEEGCGQAQFEDGGAEKASSQESSAAAAAACASLEASDALEGRHELDASDKFKTEEEYSLTALGSDHYGVEE